MNGGFPNNPGTGLSSNSEQGTEQIVGVENLNLGRVPRVFGKVNDIKEKYDEFIQPGNDEQKANAYEELLFQLGKQRGDLLYIDKGSGRDVRDPISEIFRRLATKAMLVEFKIKQESHEFEGGDDDTSADEKLISFMGHAVIKCLAYESQLSILEDDLHRKLCLVAAHGIELSIRNATSNQLDKPSIIAKAADLYEMSGDAESNERARQLREFAVNHIKGFEINGDLSSIKADVSRGQILAELTEIAEQYSDQITIESMMKDVDRVEDVARRALSDVGGQ